MGLSINNCQVKFFCLFLAVVGNLTRNLVCARQVFYHWATSPAKAKIFFFPNIYMPRVLVPSKLIHEELGLVTQTLKGSQETKYDGLCQNIKKTGVQVCGRVFV